MLDLQVVCQENLLQEIDLSVLCLKYQMLAKLKVDLEEVNNNK